MGGRGRQRNGRGQAPLLRGGRGPRLRDVWECGRGQGSGSNEIRATVVDHVVNHGRTMLEAATMIQPNLRSNVASIIRTFRNENRSQVSTLACTKH